MGMAAGQARLLSITSRMSDNELRAQLINNDKMRLATKSAQVSDAYVQALNDTQMMFTNYDADNNTSYQQLTYNSLTAFNPYNNQYAISNSAGQVLVSEKDATNFKNANGDLNKFLGMYGLEQTTTYFDNLKESYTGTDGTVAYYTGDVSSDNPYASTGYTAEELEAMYFGGTITRQDANNQAITEIYNSYSEKIASTDYYNYTSALSNFNEKYDAYCLTLADGMDAKLDSLKGILNEVDSSGHVTGSSEKSLQEMKTLLDNYKKGVAGETGGVTPTLDQAKQFLKCITDFLDKADNFAKTGTTYFTDAKDLINNAMSGDTNYAANSTSSDGQPECIYNYDNANNTLSIAIDTVKNTDGNYVPVTDANGNPVYTYVIKYDSSSGKFTLEGFSTETKYKTDGSGKTLYLDSEGRETTDSHDAEGHMYTPIVDPSKYGASLNSSGAVEGSISNGYYTFTLDNNTAGNTNTADDITIKIPATLLDKVKNDEEITDPAEVTITEVREPDINNMLSAAEQILTSIETAIYTVWDTSNPAFAPDPSGNTTRDQAYRNCVEAAKTLYKVVFKTGSDPSFDIGEVDKFTELFSLFNNPDNLKKFIDGDTSVATSLNGQIAVSIDAKAAFKNIYEVITLDRVMNTYGEPATSWIDSSNVTDSYNENGDAKAQWYTNLFTRMQKGYSVLQDGLASSPEWIQFAFESGLVTLEQVDSKFAWNTLMYSNCSDITEQTNSEAVAIAEAEYNAAMNKIENKDKMYDLELKNIDTEHNSLETEYESIKSAIDKNVERTFKIYS